MTSIWMGYVRDLANKLENEVSKKTLKISKTRTTAKILWSEDLDVRKKQFKKGVQNPSHSTSIKICLPGNSKYWAKIDIDIDRSNTKEVTVWLGRNEDKRITFQSSSRTGNLVEEILNDYNLTVIAKFITSTKIPTNPYDI
jgi:hypothetical protein